MATIRKEEAVERLIQAVNVARADDLVEIYYEIFPEVTATQENAEVDSPDVTKKILAHIANGLEVEEILDLWNVVFPAHRNVWFDEDECQLHFDDKVEHVGLWTE